MTPARLPWLTAALAGLAFCAGGTARAGEDGVLSKALAAGARARQAGDWDDALRIYKDADAATAGAAGANKAWLLSDLAFTYLQLGQYQDAEPCYDRSARLYGALYDAAAEGQRAQVGGWLSVVLKSQGYCEELLGNDVAAEKCLRRSLDIARQHRKPGDPFFARALTQLGTLYREMGRDDDAGARLREAMRRAGPDSPEHAAALNELGQLHFQQAQAQPEKKPQLLAEAEREFRASRQELEADPKADAVVLGACLNNLAWLYQAQGRNEEAEEAYKRGLELLAAKLGKGNPRVAKAESNLGWLYFQTGRDEDARQHFDRSLDVREKRFAATSPDHPELAFSRLNLALLDARQDRWAPALRQTDLARRSLARYQQANLPFLSEPEQLEFLAQERDDVYRSVALGVARPGDERAAELSAEWALNAKGVGVRVSALRTLLGRDRGDPRMSELVGVRTRLANLTLRGAAAGQADEQRRQMAELEEKEQDLIRLLGGDVARLMGGDPWVSLAAVRATVPRGAVLIEVAKFDAGVLRPSAAAAGQALHYGAWVVPAAGEGKVRVVDLGDMGPVDDAVAAVHAAIEKAPDDIRKLGERGAEAAFRKTLAPLGDLLLQPLQKEARVEDKARWIVSPEGSLWLVPWEMLPLPDNRYAVEDHLISYVVSGSDLAARPGGAAGGAKLSRAVVMAHPDYDLTPAKAGGAPRGGARTRGASGTVTLRRFAGIRFDELEGSEEEARLVELLLTKLTGERPDVYMDTRAQERVFKNLRSPRYLVLSTHGFTLAPDAGGRTVDPLYLCGLALAGANNRAKADLARGEDDGILTGQEIVGTDLRGTELAVLSACESGVGTVRDGEGVASLRQAFLLAGARSVAATLWEISDQETPEIMSHLFGSLVRGAGKAEALRAAERARIDFRRKRYGGAHPFYWAAFTVTGVAD